MLGRKKFCYFRFQLFIGIQPLTEGAVMCKQTCVAFQQLSQSWMQYFKRQDSSGDVTLYKKLT